MSSQDGPAWPQEEHYRQEFWKLNGVNPYPYQLRLARTLVFGHSVALQAPTGVGKTKAVLTPFLADELDWPGGRPTRLIYALPLRSLVQQIHQEAADILRRSSHPEWIATIQTGEQPDDEFFDRGRVIVTTYDQVLSGLLCAPYGLSPRQRNMNAAALAGSLVVFDEFHLMGIKTALLTGATGLRLFGNLTQSVWMTATATSAPVEVLRQTIDCVPLTLTADDIKQIEPLKSTKRWIKSARGVLNAAAVKRIHQNRTIVIVNTVERARVLYSELYEWAQVNGIVIRCLHARFFKADRDLRVKELEGLFGQNSKGQAILIATSAIEAGVNISCDHLLTELCPMNSLLQRAGRCARFPGEQGTVHVFSLPAGLNSHLPYGQPGRPDPALAATESVLTQREPNQPANDSATANDVLDEPVHLMSPDISASWVERVHGPSDASVIRQFPWRQRLDKVRGQIHASMALGVTTGVSELIREVTDSQVRAIIASADALPRVPSEREAFNLSRYQLERLVTRADSTVAWYWNLDPDPPCWSELRSRDDLQGAYIVCLAPSAARYSSDTGLDVSQAGDVVSPVRSQPKRFSSGVLHRETWLAHTLNVANEIRQGWTAAGTDSRLHRGFFKEYGLTSEMIDDALRTCALLHDAGKLQCRWQKWAIGYQLARDPSTALTDPLAHTDFDWSNPRDRYLSNAIQPTRGTHAVASAWYGMFYLAPMLLRIPDQVRLCVALSCAAAILAHHGGQLTDHGKHWTVERLVVNWGTWIEKATGVRLREARVTEQLGNEKALRELSKGMDRITRPEHLETWFAFLAYVMRELRLADHHASAMGGAE